MPRKRSRTISRRKLLTGAALATTGAAAGTLAAPQVSRAQGVVLRMQSTWPADQIFHEMAQEYVDRVERMAGRRLRIDLRPGGTIVPGIELHDACNDGRLDAGHAVPVFLGLRHPAIWLFTAGHAFGADSAVLLAWMHRGGGQELYDELLNTIVGPNLISLYTLPMPNQPFGWFREPLTSPGDLVGLRFRIVGGAAQLARKMGMIVAIILTDEVPQYMERGLLDAFELNNPTFDRRLGAHEVAKHYMMASFHQPVEFLEVVFNKARFQSLPDEHQAILRYAAEAASTANYSTALDAYSRDLQTLIEEEGVTVSRTPDAILDRQLEAWDEVIAGESADPLFARILASQKAWCERVGFYQSMNTPDYRRAYRHSFPDRL
jgi:TRAP-type mannitol/chloroaromatic compound transport system substrate-binding protein